MDMKANKKKLGLKEKYAHMTRGLDWETSYQPQEKVFPQATFEGIKVTLCTHSHAMGLHTWLPNADEMDWLSAKYPNTFDKYYRPRFDELRQRADKGERFFANTLPMLCQVCQIPMLFTEPDDPTKICYRESEFQGEKYHTCSDGCKHIFDDEPEKYIQAWLPVYQLYQGNCWPEGTDPTAEGFNPVAKYLEWCHVDAKDAGDYEGSSDQANFAAWRGAATQNT